MSPAVSVVMSVHNGGRFLPQALESILSQTFTDFEFLIIDDHSVDSTSEILRVHEANDSRIHLLVNEVNLGLTRSLNKGIALASSKYIARMDADDISLPGRLENQLNFLETHPMIGAAGTCYEEIDEDNHTLRIRRLPVKPILARWHLCFGNPLAHSSVVFRRSIFEQVGGYDPEVIFAQDYDLWARFSMQSRLANLPEVFLKLRKHNDSITSQQNYLQHQSSLKTSQRVIQQTLGKPIPLKFIVWLGERQPASVQIGWITSQLMVQLCRAILSEQPGWTSAEKRELVEFVFGQMVNKFWQYPTDMSVWPYLFRAILLSPHSLFKKKAPLS